MATRLRPSPRTNGAPPNGATRPAAPPRPGSPYPVRRRWRLVAIGVPLVALSAWAAAVLYAEAGDRREVVAVARPVARYTTLARDDLTVVGVAADGTVATVAADQIDHLVGRVAAVGLPAGSLVGEGALLPAGERAVGPDERVVGVLVAAGASPVELEEGVPVQVVVAPAASQQPGQDAAPAVVDDAWILDVGGATSAGDRTVSVVVPAADAPTVAAASTAKRVSLAVTGA